MGGASMVSSRIMETMLLYALDSMQGNFSNIKDMMEDTIKVGKVRWYNSIKKYLDKLKINWDTLIKMPREELKIRVKDYDTEMWKKGLLGTKTQEFYVLGKKDFGYDMCYRNTYDSTFLAKARLNALKLEDQIGRGKRGYDKTCKLCNLAKEDMAHFIIDCPALERERNYDLIKKLGNNSRDKMIDLLFGNDRFQEVGCMLRKLWQRRRKILTYIQKENATRSQPKRG